MSGVYISVPFCRTKCSYCNFASDVFSKNAYESYVHRVIEDIRNSRKAAAELGCILPEDVDSIYLGGGTPSVLDGPELERIFETVLRHFSVLPNAEITVECAPGSLSAALIDTLARCGVNRVSLGVQSFVDHEAAAVGRLHKRATVLEEIARLREAGISNINIDLIAGLPHQTAESWDYSLDEIIATGAPHVSVYMLEVDEDSRLGRELIAGGTRYHAHFVPDDAAIADFYEQACERLESAGIPQYEISNFARSGYESKHNLKYWTRQPYIGFGVDAHSMLTTNENTTSAAKAVEEQSQTAALKRCAPQKQELHPAGTVVPFPVAVRFSTPDSLDGYMNRGPLKVTTVSQQAELEESFFLGLRLNRGVDLESLRASFGHERLARCQTQIDDCVREELLEQQGSIIRLTPRGRLLSNEVFARFLAEQIPTENSALQSGAMAEGPQGTRCA